MASDIEDNAGESTPWYASFWKFCAAYLNDRFGAAWCLSGTITLVPHAGIPVDGGWLAQ